jgi:hypothetical protein
LVLSAPASRFGVNTALLRFFEALSAESADGLTAVFEANAQAHFAGGSSTSALGSWLRRFARADYYAISPEAVVHPTRLLTFSGLEASRFKARNPLPLTANGEEILAQVTIDDPDILLLGNRICFVLRPHPDGYRISATYEEVAR